jgi:hypothetical protein
MAKFEITMDEYRRWNHIPITKPWKRNLMWSVCVLILIASLIIGQYAFSFIWGVILLFVYFTFHRMSPRMELNRLTNNPFARGPFDVEFREDAYVVRVQDSILELAKADLGRVHDLDDYFRLDHKSLFSLSVPKRALAEAEIEVIESYRKEFPGEPENRTIPDY